ncbi:MAG: hypothetical protein A2Z20_02890 [Bdellovibrionales bacterium RBG_16_40_8]|nr:MAG: hypothetical protein A2Z20_02890 [Bdellovibrionales bacterium RBG_16_40_8]
MKKEKVVTTEAETYVVIEKYGRQFALLMLLGVLVYGSYLVYNWNLDRSEKNAQEELFVMQKKIETKANDLAKADEEATKTKLDKKIESAKKSELEKTPEALTKNFAEQIQEYEAFIQANKGRKAESMAAIRLAELSVEYNDFLRAEKILSAITLKHKDDVFFGLVKMQLGSVLMDEKKYSEAIEQFTLVVDTPEQKAFHPQALLRIGACHLETGDYLKAESILSRLEADHPTTQAANEGKNLRRLALLKKAEKS